MLAMRRDVCVSLADAIAREQSLCVEECYRETSFTECLLECLSGRVRSLRMKYVEAGCNESYLPL